MADENTLLGTSGKEAVPFEYQVEEQKIARKRALARAMMAQGNTPVPPPQMFGNHMANTGIAPYLSQALDIYLGHKRAGEADAEQARMMERMQQRQNGDMSAVSALQMGRPPQPQTPLTPNDDEGNPSTQPGPIPAVPGDTRAAIARAMISPFGGVQARGAQMAKEEQAKLLEMGKLLGNTTGAQFVQGGNPQAPVQAPVIPPVGFQTDPLGNTLAVSTNAKGEQHPTYAPKATNVNLRVGEHADQDAVKYFNYGGKGFDKGLSAKERLTGLESVLRTLDQNPQLGAGAEAWQMARKWAETMGVPISSTTTPTEMAKMQLGQAVLQKLGGLGNQISDADRKFMEETQGSIGNDPEALRRMMLLSAKYLIKDIQYVNTEAAKVADRHPDKITLPHHEYSFNLGNRNAEDFNLILNGKDFAPPPVPAAPPGRLRRKP